MTFVPSGDTAKIAKAGQDIATYLNKVNGLNYKVEVGTSEAASIEAMGGNKAHVGFLNTFAIVLAKTKYDIEVALVNQRKYTSPFRLIPTKTSAARSPYYKGQFLNARRHRASRPMPI